MAYVLKPFMKKEAIMKTLSLLLILLLISCNNRTSDSEKRAKEENRERIDSQARLDAGPTSEPVTLSRSDADFLVEAASGGNLEVQLGHMVENKSTSEQVRAFGSMMIKDHEEGREKLKRLAIAKNVILPDSISAAQQKSKDKLQKENKDFDRAYINLMVDDHKKDIREFQKAAKDASDSEVKAFAADHLAMLYKHLDSAEKILKRMGPERIPVSAPPYE
jgi:putative membrane protein